MKMLKSLGLSLAAAGLLAAIAHAVPIQGSIGFGGVYNQVGGTQGNLTTATSMTIPAATVDIQSRTGDLATEAAPFTFVGSVGVNGNAPSLVGNNLWTVTVGARTFSLLVATSVQTFTSAVQLNLAGTGTMSDGAGGLDDTSGVWQIGFGVSGSSFTWQSTTGTVPDGGTTVMLLGAALAGLTLVRRKLSA
jgi:protein with PEP-CTERM/exosortase system signal